MDILIEAPFNLGLKAASPGLSPGVRFLPDALGKRNLAAELKITRTERVESPPYQAVMDESTGILNAPAVAAYSKRLGEVIDRYVKAEKRLLVIGGDCSILLGITLGLKKNGNYGLFFMDGHTDFITTAESSTKAVAGMDLALIAGRGPELLTNLDSLRPYVLEQNIYCFGNREYDPVYEYPVYHSEVSYFHLEKIREIGISEIVTNFLGQVAADHLNGFWIHLDADVLDDRLLPCVDSRTPDGLSYEELEKALLPLLRSDHCLGLSVTILDPDLDTNGSVTDLFAKNLFNIINTCKTA